MTDFATALNIILGFEGGYSHRRTDPETNYGITRAVARDHGYVGKMRDLPLATAARIYRAFYWDACRCDELPAALRLVVFDAAVNSGVGQSIKWLQATLGVEIDGRVGPLTLAAAAACDAPQVARALLLRRERFLRSLRKWREYGKGWSRRLAALEASLPC
jgi:lysozyme family protein